MEFSLKSRILARLLSIPMHNSGLMNQFLTNGFQSIPKLISIREDGVVLYTWGPRPFHAQQLMLDLKRQGIPKSEWGKQIQLWYAKNNGEQVVSELKALLLDSK